MNLNELLRKAEELPAVSNGLMLKQQAAYCLAWNSIVGKQEKVLYNAMGPDLATVLLTTNASEIIGVDVKGLYQEYLTGFILGAWHLVDKTPVYIPGAMWYLFDEENTIDNFEVDKEDLKRFERDLNGRKERGYWDISYIVRWETERLITIELKKLGIDRNTISINEELSTTTIEFDWAFPGERETRRTLRYISGNVSEVVEQGVNFSSIDCYYEKALPEDEVMFDSLQALKPSFNSEAIILIGKKWSNDKTAKHKKEAKSALNGYEEITADNILTEMIESLPDDGYSEWGDEQVRITRYGMELFGFKKS